MPPLRSSTETGSALTNILTALQSIAQNISLGVQRFTRTTPGLTSGQLSADKLVSAGFVRVTGISIIAAGSPVGTLDDANLIANAAAGNVIYTLPSTAGFYPVQMIFTNGLVYKAGTSEKIAIFYERV